MLDDTPARLGIRQPEDSGFLLEFDTVGSEFHRGFQCGEIWACLVDEVREVQSIITADNCEMVMRMTDAANYTFEGRYLTQKEIVALDLGAGEWMVVDMRLKNE